MSILRHLKYNLVYINNPPWDTGTSPPELLDFIRSNPPGKALDLGCGTGTNAITLAKNGWQVTAVDFIAKAIRQARVKCRQENCEIRFEVGDVTQLRQITDKFDFILDIGCFHSFKKNQVEAYTSNVDRLLALNGYYLLYGFTDSKTKSIFLSDRHLNALNRYLFLVNRKDGIDKDRLSAWFLFKRHLYS
jgi:cyclopropane fatty-acyl-phospholipid synthase-like methyltransferase